MDYTYMLKNLSTLTNVEFFQVSADGDLLSEGNICNPIRCNTKFREELVKRCQTQEIPYIKKG